MFGLWDRSGRDPALLVELWKLFQYDLAFIDDITLCCQLLEFQRKRKNIAEVFGV